jgi:hypothetical protein
MKIFILDKANRTEGHNRDWKKMVPLALLLDTHENWVPEKEDLVIIHRSDFECGGSIDPALTRKLRKANLKIVQLVENLFNG